MLREVKRKVGHVESRQQDRESKTARERERETAREKESVRGW